jgi:hypothetical protein
MQMIFLGKGMMYPTPMARDHKDAIELNIAKGKQTELRWQASY